MDKQNFMDDVIHNMTSGLTEEPEETVSEIPTDDAENDGFISTLTLGKSYTVVTDGMDWENMIDGLPNIKQNELAFQDMLSQLVTTPIEERDDLILHIVKTTNTFMESMGITLNYDELVDRTDTQEVMMYLFDTILFLRDFIKQIEFIQLNKMHASMITKDEMHSMALADLLGQIGDAMSQETNQSDDFE